MTSEAHLDERLRALARAVEWPAAVDIAPAVASAVARDRRPVARHTPAPAWRPALAGLAVVVLAVSAVLALSPAARTAVARLLGFPGVAVEVTTEPAPELSGVDLGEEVSVAGAQERAGFELRELPLPLQRVSYDQAVGAVHLVYRLDDGRVALLTQLRGADEVTFLKQSPQVRPTEVDGEFALWASGPEHAILRVGDDVLEARLSANALLWAAAGVTYRLEIDAELPEAVRLAEQLR